VLIVAPTTISTPMRNFGDQRKSEETKNRKRQMLVRSFTKKPMRRITRKSLILKLKLKWMSTLKPKLTGRIIRLILEIRKRRKKSPPRLLNSK